MGRFLIGFVIGLAVGVLATMLASPRNGKPQPLGEILRSANDAAKRASELKQQEMWADYRSRVQQQSQPKPNTPAPWEPYER
jgi:gas vesicle protein